MNSIIKCFRVLIAIIIFGFTSNSNLAVASNTKLHSQKQDKAAITYAKHTADYFLQTTDGELFSKTASSQQSNTNHNPFSNLFILVKLWNQKLQTNYSQYNFYSKKLLVTFNRTDIFYPFHHFW